MPVMKRTPKQQHNFGGKVCHWQYCKNCGLVALKNDATRSRMSQPCPGGE